MKRLLRRIRDQPAVLAVCVTGLRCARTLGFLRSRLAYSRVPYRGIVTVDCGNGGSYRIESRGGFESALYWDGMSGHEAESMRLWVREARKSDVVLDIGANGGIYALAAAAVGAGTVHAFEPLPRAHAILSHNLSLNDKPQIKAWPFAVGSEDGIATIYDPGGLGDTASLSTEFASKHFGDLPGSDVRVVTIDSFCREHGIASIDLVKVDVEGYEEHALRGMHKTVSQSRPIILMEVLADYEAPLRKIVQELWPGVYSWTWIDEGPGHGSRNVLLRPLVGKILSGKNGR